MDGGFRGAEKRPQGRGSDWDAVVVNLRQLRTTLIEADLQVYVMGLFDRDYSVKHTREERNGPRRRDFPIVSLDELPAIGEQIARDLPNQYILGYSPPTPATDGKYHRVNLTLISNTESAARAYYRRGYYAPVR